MPLSNPSQVSVNLTPPASTTSTASSAAATLTSSTVVSATASRKGLTIWNNSTANLYLDFGSSPTISNYAVKVNAGGYYEVPYSYTRCVGGVWDGTGGSALFREFT